MNELAAKFETYTKIADAISKAVELFPANRFSSSSALWKELFASRKKSLGFDNLLNLLNTGNDLTKGIANKVPENQIDIYRRYYEDHFTSGAIASMPMGVSGNPTPFFVHGIPVSLPLVQNYVRTQRISAFLSERRMKKTGLKVLEIGAGFGGMASLLISGGVVGSYTVVDLPENLAQSAFFLTSANPDFHQNFCGPQLDISGKALNFIIPQQIDLLDGKQFDLVINCDSLGEMPSTVAQSYVELILNLLVPDGIFYSKNGHMRSTGTVPRVSAYGYDKFDILSLYPTPLPSMVFDDHSHELFLGRKTGNQSVDWKSVDTICDLFKFGLSAELKPLCTRIAAGAPADADIQFLAACEAAFSGVKPGDQTFGDPDLDGAFGYVSALAQFANDGNAVAAGLLDNYAGAGKSAVAEAQARIMLSETSAGRSLNGPYANGVKTEFLIETIQQPIRTSRLQRGLYLRLRKDLINARLKRVHQYEYSPLIRFKNRLRKMLGR